MLEADDFARGEVLAGGLVGQLGELANEFLEDGAHLGVAHGVGVEIDGREFLGDEVEQAGLPQAVELGVKLEVDANIADGGREGLEVGAQVFADVVLIAHQLLQIEGRSVVEELAGFLEEEGLGVEAGFLTLRFLGEDGVLRAHRARSRDGGGP